MKNLYLLCALFLAGSTAFGQHNHQPYEFGLLEKKVYQNLFGDEYRPTQNYANHDRALNILWTENFTGSNGLTTPNGDWTTAGTDGAFWSIDAGTVAPNGYPLSMSGDHLLWNSYDPIVNVEQGFATTQVDGAIVSPTINLSGYTEAALEFNLNAMFCCNDEPWTISVSNDDGGTWSDEIPLNLDLGPNDNTNAIATPVGFSVIISDYLDPNPANNDDCKIRFTWQGLNANNNGQISTHYYWTIDDIVIYELPQYDIQHLNLWLSDVVNSYEYTSFPTDQVSELTLQSEVRNYGAGTPTNFALETTVFDDANAIVDGPVSGGAFLNGTLQSGDIDTMTYVTGIDLTNYALGEYRVRVILTYDETDEFPENDTLWRTFRITQNSLGHVNYDLEAVSELVNFSDVTTRTGAYFTIADDVELHGVDMFLLSSGGTVDVTSVDVLSTIYVVNMTTETELAAFEYELKSEMLDNWYTFNFHKADNNDFDAPIVLEADNTYAVVIETFGGEVLWYTASLADADFSGAFYYGGDQNWYWNGNEPWVVLNFDESLTSGEPIDQPAAVSLSQNVPNPFSGQTIINYNLNESLPVSIEIVDISGKVSLRYNEGIKAAGQHNIQIDGNQLSNGIYFYTFMAGKHTITKRMVVAK